MTASPDYQRALDSRGCDHCDCPKGERICTACAEEEHAIDIRSWLTRQKTIAPGLTDAEVAIVERLIADLEALLGPH